MRRLERINELLDIAYGLIEQENLNKLIIPKDEEFDNLTEHEQTTFIDYHHISYLMEDDARFNTWYSDVTSFISSLDDHKKWLIKFSSKTENLGNPTLFIKRVEILENLKSSITSDGISTKKQSYTISLNEEKLFLRTSGNETLVLHKFNPDTPLLRDCTKLLENDKFSRKDITFKRSTTNIKQIFKSLLTKDYLRPFIKYDQAKDAVVLNSKGTLSQHEIDRLFSSKQVKALTANYDKGLA